MTAMITAVDGGLVQLEGDGLVVDHAKATAFGVWSGKLGRHELTVGSRDLVAEPHVNEGIELTEQYRLRSGDTILLGKRVSPIDPVTKLAMRTVFGVWLGGAHSVQLWVSGDASLDELTATLLAVFGSLKLTEVPTGVIIESEDDGALALEAVGTRAPDVACNVIGLGLVDVIRRTPEQEFQIPRSPGTPVEGGQLWLESTSEASEEGEMVMTLLLVGSSSISRISTGTTVGPEPELIERSSRLKVDWTAPLDRLGVIAPAFGAS